MCHLQSKLHILFFTVLACTSFSIPLQLQDEVCLFQRLSDVRRLQMAEAKLTSTDRTVAQYSSAAEHIILCVGDSLTYGQGASSSDTAYPRQLQSMLGNQFKVLNFGVNGTAARKHHSGSLQVPPSYWDTQAFQDALNASAHAAAVFIMLGTNDARILPSLRSNLAQYFQEFRSDYVELVKLFQASSSQPTVYLMVPPPAYRSRSYCEPTKEGMVCSNQTFINEVLPVEVAKVAYITGAKLITDVPSKFVSECPDFNNDVCKLMSTPDPVQCMLEPPEASCHKGVVHSDTIHPDDEGYHLIAEVAFRALRNDTELPVPISYASF